MRLLIADRFGKVIDELMADIESASWILCGIGKLRFNLATSDEKCRPDLLAFGNRVWVEFDNGLPPWAGVIDTPRSWSSGTVTVTAYTIEHLLRYRITDRGRYFSTAPVGAIFAALLQECEAEEPLNIKVGQCWYGGVLHSPAYHFKSLWWILSESLTKMERCEFEFVPMLRGGAISWTARLAEVVGEDRSAQFALVDGVNLEAGAAVDEQGDIVNVAVAVGAGTTWGSDRPISAVEDTESRGRYGLRAVAEQYGSVSQVETLERHARRRLLADAKPRLRFQVSALDTEPARFGAYRVGDILRCELSALWGWRGRVRVLAREYHPRSGTCSLVIEEYRPERALWVRQDLDVSEE